MLTHLGDTHGADAGGRGRRWRSCSCSSVRAAGARLARRRDLRRRRRAALRPRRPSVAIVGEIDSGLPSLGLPDGSRRRLPASAASRPGSCWSASRKGWARPRATPPGTLRDRPNRELIGLGAANLGAGLSSGMVVNGSLSKTAVNGARRRQDAAVRARRRRAHRRDPAVPDRAVRVPARGDARRRRDRRRHRARRRPRAAPALPLYTRPAGPDLRRARPVRTSSPPSPRCSACSIFDTLPGLFIGIASRCCCCSSASPSRTSPSSAWCPARPRPFVDLSRHPESHRRSRRGCARVEGGLFFANADAVRSCGHEGPPPGTRASCSTPRRFRSSTSPRCACSGARRRTRPQRPYTSRSPTESGKYETSFERQATSTSTCTPRWPMPSVPCNRRVRPTDTGDQSDPAPTKAVRYSTENDRGAGIRSVSRACASPSLISWL